MLFAIINSEKVEASPKISGACPLCKKNVFSKCGEINVWHWAHHKDVSCDSWYEPETEWHKNWKLAFGKYNCEIVISKDGVRHIADILTNDNVVIELQNSPIPKPIVRRRENFYGDGMLWVINGKHFKNNFFISSLDSTKDYWNSKYIHTPEGIVNKTTGEIVYVPKNNFTFIWNWPRKSWTDVQRNLFIDFGDENLFWVTEGMGTNNGKGILISKEIFLNKYGGNTDFSKVFIDKKEKRITNVQH